MRFTDQVLYKKPMDHSAQYMACMPQTVVVKILTHLIIHVAGETGLL